MRRSPSLQVFTLLFGVIYAVCFYFSWTLFRYYPATGQFSIAPLPVSAGPAINWYGWMAIAAIISTVAALIVPRSLAARLNSGWSWIVPALTLAAVYIYESRWFY